MDEKDLLILKELQKDSRIPSKDLGNMLELSETEIDERIYALKKTGVLRGCTAIIDNSALDTENVRVILSLKVSPEKGRGYDGIAEQIAQYPEVETVRLLTGTYDFQVVIQGKTMAEVSRFIAEQIASLEGVKETMTQIIMRPYKEHGLSLIRSGMRNRQLIGF